MIIAFVGDKIIKINIFRSISNPYILVFRDRNLSLSQETIRIAVDLLEVGRIVQCRYMGLSEEVNICTDEPNQIFMEN